MNYRIEEKAGDGNHPALCKWQHWTAVPYLRNHIFTKDEAIARADELQSSMNTVMFRVVEVTEKVIYEPEMEIHRG